MIEGDVDLKKKERYFYLALSNLTCALLFFALLVTFGSVSLSFHLKRETWRKTGCFVNDIAKTQKLSCRETEYGDDCVIVFPVYWNVTYYNPIAKLVLNHYLVQEYDTMEQAYAKSRIFHENATFTCWFQKKDFQLRWSLPYSNYLDIGIFALICGVMVVAFAALFCFFRFPRQD